MRTKSVNVLLALIATLLIYLICFSLFSCSEPDTIPTCDWVSAKFNGSKIAIKIHSDSDQVQYCREYVSGTRCFTIRKEYFSCVSISADYGDILTFVDNDKTCIVQAGKE